MSSACPACHHQQVSTLVPAGSRRYAVCARCASLYLSPMSEGGKSIPAQAVPCPGWLERQLLGRLARVGLAPGSAVMTNLESSGLARSFDLRPARWEPGKRTPGGPVGGVVLAHAIERVADPDTLVSDLREALEPGGALALVTPNALFARQVLSLRRGKGAPGSDAGSFLRPSSRRGIYSAPGLVALLTRHGFAPVRVFPAAPDLLAPGPRWLPVALYGATRALQVFLPRLVLAHEMVCTGVRKD